MSSIAPTATVSSAIGLYGNYMHAWNKTKDSETNMHVPGCHHGLYNLC